MDKAVLIGTVRQEYGLQIESLTFSPTDWTAYCYVAECAHGERYFLKLTSDSGLMPFAASDRDFYLPLTHQLCTKRILPNVACPVRAIDGRFTVRCGDHVLILFHFIEGRPVGFGRLPDDMLAQLARLVGILHASTPQITVENPLLESFDIAFEDALMDGLDALERITSADRSGKQELRRLLLSRKDELLRHLDRLRELRTLARAVDKDMVVCHTDLHGGNLVVDGEGQLYILDWENAMIAPPEHDLFFFAGHDIFWDHFLPIYERENGPVDLDSRIFGFYYYRRNLEDLTDFVVRILHYNTENEQDREDLAGIAEDCIAGWPYLEMTIRQIDERLAQGRHRKSEG
jgi:spectinomycin phosphotransferase